MKSNVDVLAVGAHPDDVELGCAGLLLSLRARGHRFAIVDLTAGERGSRGDAATRKREAKAAAELLGASARECLGLPDSNVQETAAAVRSMVETLRKYRPRLVVSMHADDRHPDHAACARIVERAAFLAALTRYDAAGEPHRPVRVIRYSRHPWFVPSFVVDITEFVEQKLAAIRCYESQFTRTEPGAKTPISHPGFEEDVLAFWRHFGRGIGALYAEPYAMDGPPALVDPVQALCMERRDIN
ncbi:MAG: bacillithiol biosynthesis deacetylase BshB1 [Planctomycetota bacterium]|nr:bacillithiol biosynthesis deacetylase BshB1 [Planctomycetota bacterium]